MIWWDIALLIKYSGTMNHFDHKTKQYNVMMITEDDTN